MRLSGPTRSRTALFDELLDHFLKVWITGAEAAREPISAALGNSFAVRYHVELASLARYTDSFDVKPLLDQGHETRDLSVIVRSRWAVNDFNLHTATHCTHSNALLETHSAVTA
jgi:hypothetical protein